MALTITPKTTHSARWFDYQQNGETVARFLIRPIDNKRYQVAVERNQLGTRAEGFEIDNIPEDARLWFEKDADAVARYLLQDWEGIEKADGTTWPFSHEAAYEVFTQSAEGIVIWAWIRSQAEELALEVVEETNQIVKKP